jgi:hypothetical protein
MNGRECGDWIDVMKTEMTGSRDIYRSWGEAKVICISCPASAHRPIGRYDDSTSGIVGAVLFTCLPLQAQC